jgi:pimeloyl-ACP methyl ester carboxylesterase
MIIQSKKGMFFVQLALAASLLGGSPLASAAPGWTIPDGAKTVEVSGYPMSFIEAGSGVAVVMLHGAWVDHRFLASQVTEFSKTHRAIAVSLRHYYPEPWDGKEGAFSVSQHANDVAAMIRQLNLGKVHLLGHSRGGAVAINVARQAPELIRTLILEDAGGLEPLLADESAARQRIEGSARLGAFLRSTMDTSDRGTTAKTAWNTANGPDAWGRMPPVMQQMITDNIGTMTTKTPYDAPAIHCDDVRKFSFPVLILHGERSQKIYSDMSAAMRQCKPDLAAPVIVPDAGHNMHFNNPTFFNKAVLEFMQRN